MTPVVESAELSNHLSLSYVEQGDISGVPMLLLHGVTDSWHSYELVLPHLPDSLHAFALTLRGHGDSGRPTEGYRSLDFSSDLAAFMDAKRIERGIIVGHSMGSAVAQRFAIDFPERTSGLVLAGSFTTLRGNECLRELWDSTLSRLTDPVDPAFVRDFQHTTQPVPKEFFEVVVAESLKVPARVWRAAFEGLLEDDFSGELAKIQAPTLIVWGDQDAFCPRQEQEKLAKTIRGSQLIVYEGAGHALHWEQPERFASELAAFAQRLASPTGR